MRKWNMIFLLALASCLNTNANIAVQTTIEKIGDEMKIETHNEISETNTVDSPPKLTNKFSPDSSRNNYNYYMPLIFQVIDNFSESGNVNMLKEYSNTNAEITTTIEQNAIIEKIKIQDTDTFNDFEAGDKLQDGKVFNTWFHFSYPNLFGERGYPNIPTCHEGTLIYNRLLANGYSETLRYSDSMARNIQMKRDNIKVELELRGGMNSGFFRELPNDEYLNGCLFYLSIDWKKPN